MTLSDYVKRRNGVSLGAPGSMQNMLRRSFGANSFGGFWRNWNPVWGYYLGRDVFRPLNRVMPSLLALVITFAVSGALHDAAVALVKWQPVFIFTPWFTLMGMLVVVSRVFNLTYGNVQWGVCAALNLMLIVGSYLLVQPL